MEFFLLTKICYLIYFWINLWKFQFFNFDDRIMTLRHFFQSCQNLILKFSNWALVSFHFCMKVEEQFNYLCTGVLYAGNNYSFFYYGNDLFEFYLPIKIVKRWFIHVSLSALVFRFILFMMNSIYKLNQNFDFFFFFSIRPPVILFFKLEFQITELILLLKMK